LVSRQFVPICLDEVEPATQLSFEISGILRTNDRPMRILALLVLTLTMVFGLTAGSLTYAIGSDHGPMVGCHHEQSDPSMRATRPVGNADSRHDQGGCTMPANCCVGLSCVVGGILPEPVISLDSSVAVAAVFPVASPLLRGVSVSPLLDPPRQSG
jgi:hypothetical protein